MSPSKPKNAYHQAQAELEGVVNSIAASHGFSLASRNPNFGKGSWVTWTRDAGWRIDELRLLFRWSGRSGHRGVYADLVTKVVLEDRSFAVDGYPTAWLARNSSAEFSIRETHDHAPAQVAETLRFDVASSIAWLDRTYSSPAAAIERLASSDRNGVGVNTPNHQAVVAQLERLAIRD